MYKTSAYSSESIISALQKCCELVSPSPLNMLSKKWMLQTLLFIHILHITLCVYQPLQINVSTPCFRLYAVIVVLVTPEFDPNTMNYDNVGPYDTANPGRPYVAAAWDNAQKVPNTLLVGNGIMTRAGDVEYTNVPLRSNTMYAVLVRVEIVSDNPAIVSYYVR